MQKRDWYYPTAYSVWGPEEHEAIQRVIKSGRFTQGEEVEAFEFEFARWHGMRYAIMVNSGSSANLIAIASLIYAPKKDPAFRPLRPGDKVIVPALAWSTTYAPLVQYGLDLVVADCNNQWNVGRYHGESAISAQVICSILGNPAHFWAEAPWPIIEDNCESIGAIDLKERRCGTRGVLNTFSLFWSHQLSAIEGGVILTNDTDLAMLCRMLRAHGWTRDVGEPETFEQEYDFLVFGYNVRGLELHAAVAREQLKKLPQMIEARRTNANYFRKITMLEELPIVWPLLNGQQSPFGIHFELEDPDKRPALVNALRSHGIDCRLPTGGSFTKHQYGRSWRDKYPTPRADKIHECGMFLGNGPLDLTEQIDRTIRLMKKVLM